MIGRGGTIPVPNFGLTRIGDVTSTAGSSFLTYNTTAAINPGESALHVLTIGQNNNASFLGVNSVREAGTSTVGVSYASGGYTQIIKWSRYPNGLASNSNLEWAGAVYAAGSTAFSIKISGNVSLASYSSVTGATTAGVSYNASINQTFLTGTGVSRAARSTFLWLTITSGNANSPLNGIGSSGLSTGSFSVMFNVGNSIQLSKPQMSSACFAIALQRQYPGIGVGCVQRHAAATTILATTFCFVAP